MSASRLFDMITNVSDIVRQLDSIGMRIEIGDDFSIYRRRRIAQVDRGPVYPMFDVAQSYIDDSNGFWVCGFDHSGVLVHTQAVRLLDLSGVSLARHIGTHRHKYITPNTTPDPDMTTYSGPVGLETITGSVCYHGEFWLPARGLGGPRSQGVTPLLSRLLFEIMQRIWTPDFVFALVPKQLAARGAHLRYGYVHCEPGSWVGPDNQVTEEDHLIWMSAKDLSNALEQKPNALQVDTKVASMSTKIASIDSSS